MVLYVYVVSVVEDGLIMSLDVSVKSLGPPVVFSWFAEFVALNVDTSTIIGNITLVNCTWRTRGIKMAFILNEPYIKVTGKIMPPSNSKVSPLYITSREVNFIIYKYFQS